MTPLPIVAAVLLVTMISPRGHAERRPAIGNAVDRGGGAGGIKSSALSVSLGRSMRRDAGSLSNTVAVLAVAFEYSPSWYRWCSR